MWAAANSHEELVFGVGPPRSATVGVARLRIGAALVVQLRQFADYAEVIGLAANVRSARAEADDLDRSARQMMRSTSEASLIRGVPVGRSVRLRHRRRDGV